MKIMIQSKKSYVIMVNGVVRKQRFDDMEDAVQYIRGMKDGGKSAKLFYELPSPCLDQ